MGIFVLLKKIVCFTTHLNFYKNNHSFHHMTNYRKCLCTDVANLWKQHTLVPWGSVIAKALLLQCSKLNKLQIKSVPANASAHAQFLPFFTRLRSPD